MTTEPDKVNAWLKHASPKGSVTVKQAASKNPVRQQCVGQKRQMGSTMALIAPSAAPAAAYLSWNESQWKIPAHNLQELKTWLYDQGMSLPRFKTTVVYRSNVARLPWLQEL